MKYLLAVLAALILAANCFAQPAPIQPAAAVEKTTENPIAASPANSPASSATTPAPDIRRVAFIGKTRDEILSTEMFSFFHFEKMQESPVPGQPDKTLTLYGQQGRFKGQAMMGVISNNSDGRILHASVTMTRDFIDNGATAPFARDLAKSFLANAPGAASAELNMLSSEIWSGCFNSSNTVNYAADGQGKYARKQCPAESEYSKAYRVFAGKDRAYQIPIPASQPVVLHNTAQTAAPASFFIDIGEP